MREIEKNKDVLSEGIDKEIKEYSESLSFDYCGFRLNSLAEKIKSNLNIKKQEHRLINT